MAKETRSQHHIRPGHGHVPVVFNFFYHWNPNRAISYQNSPVRQEVQRFRGTSLGNEGGIKSPSVRIPGRRGQEVVHIYLSNLI